MTICSSSPVVTWPAPGLPDEVTEILCELAEREGRDFIVMWLPGECASATGELLLSTMIDTRCASISFVHDRFGATWLTWLVHAGAGAIPIGPSGDAGKLAEFCYGLLMGADVRHRGLPACQ